LLGTTKSEPLSASTVPQFDVAELRIPGRLELEEDEDIHLTARRKDVPLEWSADRHRDYIIRVSQPESNPFPVPTRQIDDFDSLHGDIDRLLSCG